MQKIILNKKNNTYLSGQSTMKFKLFIFNIYINISKSNFTIFYIFIIYRKYHIDIQWTRMIECYVDQKKWLKCYFNLFNGLSITSLNHWLFGDKHSRFLNQWPACPNLLINSLLTKPKNAFQNISSLQMISSVKLKKKPFFLIIKLFSCINKLELEVGI